MNRPMEIEPCVVCGKPVVKHLAQCNWCGEVFCYECHAGRVPPVGSHTPEEHREALQKPKLRIRLPVEDGDTYDLALAAYDALIAAGDRYAAKEMMRRVTKTKDSAEALDVIGEYVETAADGGREGETDGA